MATINLDSQWLNEKVQFSIRAKNICHDFEPRWFCKQDGENVFSADFFVVNWTMWDKHLSGVSSK